MGVGGGDRDTGLQWLLADGRGEAGSTIISASSGVPKPCGCGSWGQGLGVALAVLGGWLEMMILVGFSSFKDSMIPKAEHTGTEAPHFHIAQPPLHPACLSRLWTGLCSSGCPGCRARGVQGSRSKLGSLRNTVGTGSIGNVDKSCLQPGRGLPAPQPPQPCCSREESQA